MIAPYESARYLSEYLLFHYGPPELLMPWPDGPRDALDFPRRCAELVAEFASGGRAMDLGCAVGRASFELGRSFDSVLGIDLSQQFIAAAQALAKGEILSCDARECGRFQRRLQVSAPTVAAEIVFEVGDACELRKDLGTFDAILLANLLDRLPDPAACLRQLPDLLKPGGVVVIASPYTWLEAFTPETKWLDEDPIAAIQEFFGDNCRQLALRELPFVIREHARKYQWSVAQASVWGRA